MNFVRYQHIERLDSDEVEGILDGECFIFPKIDGTCSSIYMKDDYTIGYGSRNRELSIDHDNASFMASHVNHKGISDFLHDYPNHILYGEWLVPHSLKTYRDNAWQKFYVFDVFHEDKYIHYNKYSELLDKYGIEYIRPMLIVNNPSMDTLSKAVEKNTFLIKDNEGVGEGIVIKRYDFRNKYGRQTWSKIVTNEFKDKHRSEMGPQIILPKLSAEDRVVNSLTPEMILKTKAKIVNEHGWSSKLIPMLLGMVWHDFINEEIWQILKDFKNPVIDFANLNKLVIRKTKEVCDI
jgi:hypothetical protein